MSTNKRITMKRINGRRITTIQTGNQIYCSNIADKTGKPASTSPTSDIFAELGITKVY